MRGWLLAVVGAIAAIGAAGCAEGAPPSDHSIVQPGRPGEDNRTLSPEEAATANPEVEPNDADITYVRNMIVHHQQAIDMTGLAPERAQNTQLKGLASRINDVQGPEIGMMNRWLTGHALPAVDPGAAHAHTDMPGMASAEDIAALTAASGPAFDRLFIDLMTRHHEGAIQMANDVRGKGVDVRVQEMAQDVIAEQTDEIKRLQDMR